ncbi:MAG: sulfite exporter TauE/SafE family protein [Sphingobacteriales bacterium]|nr:sulfite exporter TauE/SafE family protein [Sphingobacteriales bacterium]
MNEIALLFGTGFSIGILGSFHCVGMCGPLALALPVHQLDTARKSLAIGLYNIGRAVSYSILGGILGAVGMSFSFFKLQQVLSIIAGVFVLAVLLSAYLGSKNTNIPLVSRYTQFIKSRLSAYLKSRTSPFSYFGIGVVNGFLPCGLVYLALAAAAASAHFYSGALLMFSFGMGTMPIMAATMIFGKFISLGLRQKINKLTPYMVGLVAVLLILRGLNLGIPYISPALENQKMSCCHK